MLLNAPYFRTTTKTCSLRANNRNVSHRSITKFENKWFWNKILLFSCIFCHWNTYVNSSKIFGSMRCLCAFDFCLFSFRCENFNEKNNVLKSICSSTTFQKNNKNAKTNILKSIRSFVAFQKRNKNIFLGSTFATLCAKRMIL